MNDYCRYSDHRQVYAGNAALSARVAAVGGRRYLRRNPIRAPGVSLHDGLSARSQLGGFLDGRRSVLETGNAFPGQAQRRPQGQELVTYNYFSGDPDRKESNTCVLLADFGLRYKNIGQKRLKNTVKPESSMRCRK